MRAHPFHTRISAIEVCPSEFDHYSLDRGTTYSLRSPPSDRRFPIMPLLFHAILALLELLFRIFASPSYDRHFTVIDDFADSYEETASTEAR